MIAFLWNFPCYLKLMDLICYSFRRTPRLFCKLSRTFLFFNNENPSVQLYGKKRVLKNGEAIVEL